MTVEFEFNETLRGLLDVTRVAVGDGMPQAKASEALVILRGLLALLDRTMPAELQTQDARVVAARQLEAELVQLLKPGR